MHLQGMSCEYLIYLLRMLKAKRFTRLILFLMILMFAVVLNFVQLILMILYILLMQFMTCCCSFCWRSQGRGARSSMVQCGEPSIVNLDPEHWAEPLILKACQMLMLPQNHNHNSHS